MTDHPLPSRRNLLAGSLAASAAFLPAVATPGSPVGGVHQQNTEGKMPPMPPEDRRIFKSLKLGMFSENIPILEKFKLLKDSGFDGVELDAPHGQDPRECLAAAEATGLVIDGVVNDRHWQVRMSSPDEAQRDEAVAIMQRAIQHSWLARGKTVLLVPGHGDDGSQETIADRAEACIRRCLPIAAQLGITIAIENVWNRMFYDHDGGADQSADALAAFIDRFRSPLVGVQFDIGNHQKYSRPAEWIRTLGHRIVKLDVKDWSVAGGFCEIGAGDVEWPEVRKAIEEIGFVGWAAAEVGGGDRERMNLISRQMDEVLAM